MLDDAQFRRMVLNHEKLLVGYTDEVSLRIVPGVLQNLQTIKEEIDDFVLIKADLQQAASAARWLHKYVPWAFGIIILLLLAVVFHQYNLIPLILRQV